MPLGYTKLIDLGLYKPIKQKFRDKPLILTSQLLLDFDFLNYFIIQNPDQISPLARKLASTMLNLMAIRKWFMVAYVQQKYQNGDLRKMYIMSCKPTILFFSWDLTLLENLKT